MWICWEVSEEIEEILDLASKERFISGDSIDESQFDEDAVLEAIKETSDNSDDNFLFEFDDDDEETVEEDSLDLAIEMMESKSKSRRILDKLRKNDVLIYILNLEKKVIKSE